MKDWRESQFADIKEMAGRFIKEGVPGKEAYAYAVEIWKVFERPKEGERRSLDDRQTSPY